MQVARILPVVLIALILQSFWARLYSQTTLEDSILSNAQGIRQGERAFYELEGYNIFVERLNLAFDEKGIGKVKKKYSISKDIMPLRDTSFSEVHNIFIDSAKKNKHTAIVTLYVFPQPNNQTLIVGFRIINERDVQIEKVFAKAVLSNSIPADCYVKVEIDSIRFAGRYIVLGPACRWIDVHNVQCSYRGQMNWSEFRSLEKAERMVKRQHDNNEDKTLIKVLEEKQVDIIFEGKETKALRTKNKVKLPKIIMGGSNVLIVYYVVQEVRGKYVGAILSYYDIDAAPDNLPPLLSEVMSLKE